MINRGHFVILFILTSFASFNAVLFTPTMPKLAGFFAVSNGAIQTVILIYMLGYSIGQLFYGPIANRYGNKSTLYAGTVLEIISSIVCVIAIKLHLFHLLLVGRFFLAIGAGAGLVIAYAMTNQAFSGKEASKKVAYLTLSFAMAPGVSIFIGSILLDRWGIISCFYASLVYGILILMISTTLPETAKEKQLDALKISHLIASYKAQFTNFKLIIPGIIMGANASYMYVFAGVAPFIAMTKFHVSTVSYGFYNILPPLGLVIGGVLSANLAHKLTIKKLMFNGLVIVIVGVCSLALTHNMSLTSVLLSLFLPVAVVYLGASLVHPSAIMFGMNHSTNKANASAMLNFLNLGLVTMADAFLMYSEISFLTLLLVYIFLCAIEVTLYLLVIARTPDGH